MRHDVFTLAGEEMQIFDSFPFAVITDCDGTELVYIRRQLLDDTLCDVIFCATCLYQYANWTTDALQKFVEAYCINNLGRKIDTIQHTTHLILPTLELSDFAYGANHLKKLNR